MADLVGKITVRNSISGEIRIARTLYENDYEQLVNLPKINEIVLLGNLSFEDLGLIFDGVTIVAGKRGVLFVKDNSHKHIVENISDFPEWAKRNTKPEYTADEVGADQAGSAQNMLVSARDYTDTAIAGLINGALGEIAEAMVNNQLAIEALEKIAASKASQTDLNAHINDKNNPHGVTKSTVGLNKVDNTADSEKSVASAGKLKTARTINGVAFDGSKDITIPGDTALTNKVNMKAKTSDIFRVL